MKARYLAHSTFLITTDSGTRILTDPYEPGCYDGNIAYPLIQEAADIVTVSHDHLDHSYVQCVQGNPIVVKGPGEHRAGGLTFKVLRAFHDESAGSQRGPTDMVVFEADVLRVCHVGDLGHALSKAELDELGRVDVLFLPTGGVFTVDPQGATAVVDQIKPRVIIPMHYKTPLTGFDFASVDEFVQGKANVVRVDGPEVTLRPDALPKETQVIVLKPALV